MGKVLDLDAIREATANLDRLAAEHPELRGESTPKEWEQTLSEVHKMNEKSLGRERQRKLREKRLAQGLIRPEVWVLPEELTALKDAYPGPRGGTDWQAVIKAALEQAEKQPRPDTKTAKRKEVLLKRLSRFQVDMSDFKFDREEANARR